MAHQADDWEADETGVSVDIDCNNVSEEREIKFKNEDNGEPTTVRGERERILIQMGQPENNCVWKIVFSNNTTKVMDDLAFVEQYKDDLTQCVRIKTVYL